MAPWMIAALVAAVTFFVIFVVRVFTSNVPSLQPDGAYNYVGSVIVVLAGAVVIGLASYGLGGNGFIGALIGAVVYVIMRPRSHRRRS